MDDFVKRTLEDWNLSSLIDIFEENQIDEEAFHLLDEATIKELVKPIGPRAKLWKRIEQMKGEKDPQPEDSDASGGSCGSQADTPGPSCSSPSTSSSPGPSCSSPFSSTASVKFASPLRSTGLPPLKKFKADFSVKKYLGEEQGEIGEEIVTEIMSGTLSRRLRLEMVRILVAYMIGIYGDRPKSHIKLAVAQSIIEDFPILKDDEGEGYEAWYTPGVGRHSATGWLEERLRNVRRGPSRTPKGSTQTGRKKTKLLSTANLPEPDIDSEEFEGMKEWLRHNVQPAEKVEEYMAKTAVMRAAMLKGGGKPLATVIQEFPRLFDTPGMVELDFRHVFPEVAERMYLKWTPAFSRKVIHYANSQRNWMQFLSVKEDNLDTDEKSVNISLQLLPAILPCGKRQKQLATVQTALTSYMDLQPVGTNIPQYLEKRVVNSQPYILLLGDREDPQDIFVIAERKALPQASLLKAVDVCFKLFYLLDLQYPWQAATTWEFCQKIVYGLGEASDTTSPAVIAMRTSLLNVE